MRVRSDSAAEPEVVRAHAVENVLRVLDVLMAEPGQDRLRSRQFRARHLLGNAEIDLPGFAATHNFRQCLVNGCSKPRRISDWARQVVNANDLWQRRGLNVEIENV